MTTLPHLFPPTTNLYDAKTTEPAMLALPPIWENFDSFYSLAMLAVSAADAMAQAEGKVQQLAASLQLRAICDACHDLHLRRYVPPKVKASDYEFDFDSALH